MGSSTHYTSVEPENVSSSIYPSTLLYLSNNKVPDLSPDLLDFILDEEDEMMKISEMDENSLMTAYKTTCKKAKPNYRTGCGDNAWAQAMTLLECIYGQNPALFNGIKLDLVLGTIKNQDFYALFVESEVYNKFYKDDEDFEPVRLFLEGALNQDYEKREKEMSCWQGNIKKMFEDTSVGSQLKKDLSEYI